MLKNKSLRTRRFVAKYINYIEIFGYLFVATLAFGLFMAWFYRVDDVVVHDADPEIRPRETIVKNGEDAYVSRLFVTERFQPVKKGQPLVEIVEAPEWVERYQAVGRLKTALQEWTDLEEKLAEEAAPADGETGNQGDGGKGNQGDGGEDAAVKAAGKAPAPGAVAKLAGLKTEAKRSTAPAAVKIAATPVGEQGTGAMGQPDPSGSPLSPVPSPPSPVPPALPPGPLAPPDAQLRQRVAQALAAWEQAAGASAPKRVLKAAHDGVAVFDEQIVGQVVAKNKEIAKVADFSELRIEVKLKGEKIPDVRVGQLARIEVRPTQPPGRILRGDREGFLWLAERVQFSKLIDDPIKNWLRDELKKHTITAQDDIALVVNDVDNIQATAKLKTAPLPATPAQEGPDRLTPDAIHLLDLQGYVREAKHIGKISLAELPPEIEKGLREKLLEKIKGKVVQNGEPFRVEGFRSFAVMTQVKIEATKTPKSERERELQVSKSLEGTKVERFVEAKIVLQSPPPELTRAVELLYKKDKPAGPRVDVRVVTDRRPFAMLLFRQ